jgi:hypothetical protein
MFADAMSYVRGDISLVRALDLGLGVKVIICTHELVRERGL